MPEDKEQEQLTKLLSVVEEALRQDEALREKYQIGEKFRFIRERLKALLQEIQEGRAAPGLQTKQAASFKLGDDEFFVYVHLYNAQGASLRTWQSIVNPKAFFDYSVNRPIYQDKALIEDFIKNKPNKAQHGYLTLAIKKDQLLPPREENLKDVMGHALIKIKEGALRPERLFSFTHNELEYVLSEEGELIKKNGSG